MDKSVISLRTITRLFRKSVFFPLHRCVSNTAVKVEATSELLKTYNRDILAGGIVPVFRRALLYPTRIALQDDFNTYTYGEIYDAATRLSKVIAAQLLGETERTICYMCTNDASHVIVQWAIWMTGNIAVPLTPLHPQDMLKYFMNDSNSVLIVSSEDFEKLLRPLSQELKKPLIVYSKKNRDVSRPTQEKHDDSVTNTFYGSTEAMLIYTSGTTSKPKGVVWTHRMLAMQIAALHAAWQYSAQDVVLHTLPLHHIHGQLNSLNASLAAGARIRMLPAFASHAVWSKLLGSGEKEEARITVFHGVPAMYSKLAADYETLFKDTKTRQYVRDTLSRMRLMCAGSAPLPETLFNKWQEISGLRLLERYGMSEVGMALSNPYRPVEKRTLGCVGLPLPGISARIAKTVGDKLEPMVTVDCDPPDVQISLDRLGITGGKHLIEGTGEWRPPKVTTHGSAAAETCEGELLLKGPTIFTRYWSSLPMLNSKEFTKDGWFRTGDTASFSNNSFRILGRTSIDIIKTSGYKVSALQVESAILEHPDVADAAVLGMEDETHGEIVATVIVLKEKKSLTLRALKNVAGKKLAPYQLPKTMLIIKTMPRNALGKLDKKQIKLQYGKELILKRSK